MAARVISRRTALAATAQTAVGTVLVAASLGAWALDAPTPPEVLASMPQARALGHGRLRFMGLQVYDARLWLLPQDKPGMPKLADWATVQMALEIHYLRALKGEQIAERSLTEMQRQGEVPAEQGQRWLQQMKALFPDVKDGDRLTGLNHPGEGARFYLNGQRRGEVRDPDFARHFFGIWLSPKSSEPKLRAALLGQAPK